MKESILSQLLIKCPFPKVFEDTETIEGCSFPEPRRKIGHIRADEENHQRYFDFLEKLRQSGETNMYGAAPYLQSEFPELRGSQKRANAILIAWIKSFEKKEGGESC